MYSLDFKFHLIQYIDAESCKECVVSQNTVERPSLCRVGVLMRHDATSQVMLHNFTACCFNTYGTNLMNDPHKHIIYHSVHIHLPLVAFICVWISYCTIFLCMIL
jgi:hypothetical protein